MVNTHEPGHRRHAIPPLTHPSTQLPGVCRSQLSTLNSQLSGLARAAACIIGHGRPQFTSVVYHPSKARLAIAAKKANVHAVRSPSPPPPCSHSTWCGVGRSIFEGLNFPEGLCLPGLGIVMPCTRHAGRPSLPPLVASLEIPFRMPCRKRARAPSTSPHVPSPQMMPALHGGFPPLSVDDARNPARSQPETLLCTVANTDHGLGPLDSRRRKDKLQSQTAGPSKHMAPASESGRVNDPRRFRFHRWCPSGPR
ncbi:hypothetical protein EDB81DRAFT_161256 [Dactylonectria macrodidyma]|uniref:Uncharacterized protein n=1 Tax=Dactylonectria macrodidyma TaxID=307937 RepID=A0A9P9FN11_9HYPO|nr:hypothetical protein EDB81DRAFT_161256 [Dactylonectria macrodidyma]